MIKLNSLLEGGELKVKTVGAPKNGGVFNKILIATTLFMAVGGTALYFNNNSDNEKDTIKVKDASILSSVKNKITSTISNETSFPIYEESKLVNTINKDVLNKAGNFKLEEKLADNQIARKVSQIQFSTENYFLSLVSEGEGFRSHIYNDNIGYAFGNGWNISMQNKVYNEDLAKAISKDPEFSYKIKVLSGKISDSKISSDYEKVKIQPQRSMQIAQLMSEKFEAGVINGITKHMAKNPDAIKIHTQTNKPYEIMAREMYNNLAPNEKAAVLYHSYKVGEGGFAKYNNLLSSLISYGLSENKTDEMKQNIADKFTYKYKMNGQILEDTRASVLVGTMFASKEGFGYLIGKNVAPHNMASLTSALKKNNIDGSASPGEVQIPDPVGIEREKLEASGGKIRIEMIPAYSVQDNINSLRDKNKTKFTPLPFGTM